MGSFGKYLCELLGFEKFLPSSTGVEACESACKVARRWGYVVKGVEHDKASIVMANGCFWGRSITASGGSAQLGRYFFDTPKDDFERQQGYITKKK